MGIKIKIQLFIFLTGFFLGTTLGAFGMHWFKEKIDAPKTTQHLNIRKAKTKGKGNTSHMNIDQQQENTKQTKK